MNDTTKAITATGWYRPRAGFGMQCCPVQALRSVAAARHTAPSPHHPV